MSHFNKISREWETPEKLEMSRKYGEIIKESLSFTPQKILEVGCGTGLLGQQFLNSTNSLLGIDTSSGMLDVFNEKFQDNPRVHSRLLNLEEKSLEGKFDLIVSSMAFHHLKDPQAMVSKLKNHLADGGTLAVIDLDQEDGTFHPDPANMGVHHFGFNEEQIKSWGKTFKKTERKIINVIKKNQGEYPVFLALFRN